MCQKWQNIQAQSLSSSSRLSVRPVEFPYAIWHFCNAIRLTYGLILTVEGGLIDAEKLMEQGTPIGRYPGITLRNAHFQYIVTWYSPSMQYLMSRYSLAFATTGMCYFLFRRPRATYAERVLNARAFGGEAPRGLKGWS
jgi:cytochrome oxidase assembly protein ShyY1